MARSFAIDCGRIAASATESLTVDGRTRTVLLHVPADAAHRAVPFVLAFPGRGESAELFRSYSGVDRLDAIVAVVQGLPGVGGRTSWQGTPWSTSGGADSALVTRLIRAAEASRCVDRARIAVTGKSDGGGFAELVACDPTMPVSVLVTAAAAVYARATPCRPRGPVTVVTLHGTDDTVVPISGSASRHLLSEDAVDAAFVQHDACGSSATSTSSTSVRTEWSGCAGGTSVTQFALTGDGHTWPGALSPSGPGATSTTVSATDLLASALRIRQP